MAHVIAKNSKGPRGENLPADNTYNNLILLCPNHHSIVDKAPHMYTVNYLKEVKENFEKSINLQLNVSKEYLTDLSSLNILFKYIPINSFRAMAYELPYKVSINFGVHDEFKAFYLYYPERYPFYDKKLTVLWDKFVEKLDRINDWMSGMITNADNKFITINDMLNNLETTETGYNVYVNSDSNHTYLVLNKQNLNNKQIEIATRSISVLQQEFINVHTELVTHIRQNYKEVEW